MISSRKGMLESFDRAFCDKPMDEATVNAAVDWLIEEGCSLFDVCVVFASSPDPAKGWHWVLARFDRLTNGEEKRAPDGRRRCNAIRQSIAYFGDGDLILCLPIAYSRKTFVKRVLYYLSYEIKDHEVLLTAKNLLARDQDEDSTSNI